MPWLLYPMGRAPMMLLEYGGFVDARTCFRCFGLETNLLLLKGYEPLFLGYPDCSLPH